MLNPKQTNFFKFSFFFVCNAIFSKIRFSFFFLLLYIFVAKLNEMVFFVFCEHKITFKLKPHDDTQRPLSIHRKKKNKNKTEAKWI